MNPIVVVVVILVVQILRNGHAMQLPFVVHVRCDVLIVQGPFVERSSKLTVRREAGECGRRAIVMRQRVESAREVIGAAPIDIAIGLGHHRRRCLDQAEECVMFDTAPMQVLAGSFLWSLEAIGVYLVLGISIKAERERN